MDNFSWAVGIIEGEGNFNTFRQKGKDGKYKNHFYFQVGVGMTPRYNDVLERLQRTLGGNLYGPYKSNPVRYWRVSDPLNVEILCNALEPYLGEYRQAQIAKLRENFKHRDMKRSRGRD